MEPWKILVIDDDPLVHEMAKSAFSSAQCEPLNGRPYEVACAFDGDEGFAMAMKSRPDLIVLDWYMPNQNGLKTCQAFRAEAQMKRTPILMMTSVQETEKRTQAFDAGVDAFIEKPVEARELRSRVLAQLRRL